MAGERQLIVSVIGDDRSLQAALTRSTAATSKFGRDVRRNLTVADQFAPLLKRTREMRVEAAALSQRVSRLGEGFDATGASARGATEGMGGLAARAGLATIGLTAAYHASRRLAEGLKQTGSESFTATGKLKNFASSLLSGDIVGGIQALSKTEQTFEDLGIEAKDAAAHVDELTRAADVMGGKFRVMADGARAAADAYREMALATQQVLNASLGLRDAQGQLILGGPLGSRPGFQPQQSLADRLRAAGFTPTEGVRKPIGPTAKNAAAQILAQARQDDQALLRLQEQEVDRLRKAVASSKGNVQQREALNQQLASARAAVIGTERQIRENAAANAKVAAAAAEAARSNSFSNFIGLLNLGVDRAALTKGLNDDLRALQDLAAGLRKQAAAGVDVQGAQSQLVSVVGQIAAKQKEIAAAGQDLAQGRQFRALGLSATGEEIVPGIKNLKTRIDSALKQIASGQLDAPRKLVDRLKLARKLIRIEGKALTEETRETINEFVKAATGATDKLTKGPLTATSSLNANKLLEGLGLGRDLEKELRARLSSFNSAGLSLAGTTRPTGTFRGGIATGVVVENHNTLTLDGVVLERNITRSQQKRKRRNPTQKRGPNVGGV